MNFKEWLCKNEDVNLGGLLPPKEQPLKLGVKSGQCGAFPTVSLDKSDLPPTPNHRNMNKQKKK